jgi:hypothetical protein
MDWEESDMEAKEMHKEKRYENGGEWHLIVSIIYPIYAVLGATPVLGHSAKRKMTDLTAHSHLDSVVWLVCNKGLCHQQMNCVPSRIFKEICNHVASRVRIFLLGKWPLSWKTNSPPRWQADVPCPVYSSPP